MKKSILSIFSTIFSFILILSMFSGCSGLGRSKKPITKYTDEVPLSSNGTVVGKTIEYYTDDLTTLYLKVELDIPEYSLSEVKVSFFGCTYEMVYLNEELTKMANADKFENVLTEKGNLGEIYLAFTDESIQAIIEKAKEKYKFYYAFYKKTIFEDKESWCTMNETQINVEFTAIEGSAPWVSETPEA